MGNIFRNVDTSQIFTMTKSFISYKGYGMRNFHTLYAVTVKCALPYFCHLVFFPFNFYLFGNYDFKRIGITLRHLAGGVGCYFVY